MALVGDDEVEGFDGEGGAVGNLLAAALAERFRRLEAGEFIGVLGQFLTAQDGLDALDGGDGDAGDAVELVAGEVLDVVNLGELAAVVG